MRGNLGPLARWGLALAALATASTIAQAAAPGTPDDSRWQFGLTPYLWLPNANGSADIQIEGLRGLDKSYSASSKIGPNDYLENLQGALMLIGEARKGLWSVYTDIIYLDLGNQDTHLRRVSGPLGDRSTTLSRTAKTDIRATVWTIGGGYTVTRGRYGNLDLVLGARYLGLDSSLALSIEDSSGRLDRAGKVSQSRNDWDGLIGARGAILFPESHWFMPYYADIGTGSSKLTYEALLGVGYRFDWGDVTLAWRTLGYEFDQDNADVRFTGPGLGVGFRW